MRAPTWKRVDGTMMDRAGLVDFAVFWDDDDDLRVLDIVQQMQMAGMLWPVLAIGENKGCVTVLVDPESPIAKGGPVRETYLSDLASMALDDGDDFEKQVLVWDDDDLRPAACIIEDDVDRVIDFLRFLKSVHRLGSKP